MENNKTPLNSFDEFIEYNSAIAKYDNYIKKKFSTSYNFCVFKGYLINLEDFEEFKKNIGHYLYVLYGPQNKDLYLKSLKSKRAIKKLKTIEFNSSRYLINMLKNENKYIIINDELWKVVGEKENENNYQIEYKIDKEYIIIEFNNKEKLYFKHKNNNIIDEEAYNCDKNNIQSNFEEIKNIYSDIIQYNKIETEFIEEKKKKKKQSFEYYKKERYLISKSWIDKWKKYTNYNEIKKKFNSNKNSEKQICNNLIYHLEKNNLQYKDIENLEILDFKTKDDFDSALEKDILILIDDGFIKSFKTKNNNLKKIKFSLFDNQIYIINDNKNEEIKYNIYKNMILSKEKYNLLYLENMIKFFYFQKEINEQIKSPQAISNYTFNINNIYIINKKIMNKYKDYFEFDILCKLLKEKINDNSITYKNLDNNVSTIFSILDKEDYLKRIKNKDILTYIQLKKEDYDFHVKLQNEKSQKFISYINDFDIIDKDINLFLSENQNGKCIPGNYLAGDGKILLFFNENNNNFYEIGYFDSNNNFIIEYLIQEYYIFIIIKYKKI